MIVHDHNDNGRTPRALNYDKTPQGSPHTNDDNGPNWVPWGVIAVDTSRLMLCDPMHLNEIATGLAVIDDDPSAGDCDGFTSQAGVTIAQIIRLDRDGLYPVELLLNSDADVMELRVRFTQNTERAAS